MKSCSYFLVELYLSIRHLDQQSTQQQRVNFRSRAVTLLEAPSFYHTQTVLSLLVIACFLCRYIKECFPIANVKVCCFVKIKPTKTGMNSTRKKYWKYICGSVTTDFASSLIFSLFTTFGIFVSKPCILLFLLKLCLYFSVLVRRLKPIGRLMGELLLWLDRWILNNILEA